MNCMLDTEMLAQMQYLAEESAKEARWLGLLASFVAWHPFLYSAQICAPSFNMSMPLVRAPSTN